jgi:hypothetical protein
MITYQHDVDGMNCLVNMGRQSLTIQGYTVIDRLAAALLYALSAIMWLLAVGSLAVSVHCFVAPATAFTPDDLLSTAVCTADHASAVDGSTP